MAEPAGGALSVQPESAERSEFAQLKSWSLFRKSGFHFCGTGSERKRDVMPARILIVEDEEPLTLLLRYNLEAEGFEVDSVARGDDAELHLRDHTPDLVLLDWMLPGLSGIELCRRLRTRRDTERVPIIMLTARGEETERVRGLATGADDYVVKPFSLPELIARIQALLRRAKPGHVAGLLAAGDLELDRTTRRVRRAGAELHLGPTEFRLLEFLMQAPGRVYSRAQLLDAVWGRDVYIDERTVDVHVGRLRKAITPANAKDPLRTVRGAGYAFDETFARG
jgi:two-component system phosphate regulon response regulator PhoB